jgi:hypothetical protein
VGEWQHDAVAAGFDLEELDLMAGFVARGVVTVDGSPIEVLPDYWVIPGFLPYDGRIILATVDRRALHAIDGVQDEDRLDAIVARAVAAMGHH